MKHPYSTIVEAEEVVTAMRKGGVPQFQDDQFGLVERGLVNELVQLSKEHHRIQERYCSEDMDDEVRLRVEQREERVEARMTQIAEKLGLLTRFDGDPRGFTVKLFAPTGAVHNTWGGRESGYGIGRRDP